MKTPEYRRGYQAGYKAAKTGSELPSDMAGKLTHSILDGERKRALIFCLDVLEDYKAPVGNSAAGEMAAEWTMLALREIRDRIKEKLHST